MGFTAFTPSTAANNVNSSFPSSLWIPSSHLSISKKPISDCSAFSSRDNSFMRGQFQSRHLLGCCSRRVQSRRAGILVLPSCVLPLTEENVEKVLDEVRPGLMADGGNVALHEIDGLVVVLKLQGACGSCPSSTMTLKMGIETRLRDKIPEIEAVEQILDTETGLELNEENVEKVSQLNLSNACSFCLLHKDIINVIVITMAEVGLSFRFLLRLDHTLLAQVVGCSSLFQINDYVIKVRLSGPAAGVMTVRVALTQKLREKIPAIAAVQLIDG
ncbi:NifU-like protein 3, chloroplastic [Vitis vinifera]|uniref:NifU-like protein 3, chloroplastic n=1 Tax=Vitis vinifera TaxID=29760 RepID=A0A438D4G1_VITVI|nr:NifU-like protein 3, chloroplastic [Vitis vinifera]